MFPFSLTIPTFIVRPIRAFLVFTRVLPKPIDSKRVPKIAFPFNFVTAPLVSVLFLLAIEAIGRQEVQDGIIGANGYVRNHSTGSEPGESTHPSSSESSPSISWRSSLPWLRPSLSAHSLCSPDTLQGLLGNIHRHRRSCSSLRVLGLAQGRKVRSPPLLLSLYLLFLPGDFHWQCPVHFST